MIKEAYHRGVSAAIEDYAIKVAGVTGRDKVAVVKELEELLSRFGKHDPSTLSQAFRAFRSDPMAKRRAAESVRESAMDAKAKGESWAMGKPPKSPHPLPDIPSSPVSDVEALGIGRNRAMKRLYERDGASLGDLPDAIYPSDFTTMIRSGGVLGDPIQRKW